MSGEYHITSKDGYIHVTASGKGTLALAREMWNDIAKACSTHKCYKILGEQNLSTPLSFDDAFKHFEIFAAAGINSRHKIAWVDRSISSRRMSAFIGDVVSSRLFIQGRIFVETDDAIQWLKSA